MTTLTTRAREFALRAHDGLFRPNKAKDPYSTHLEEVAFLVEWSGGSEIEIAAAWLHDTVEDTEVELSDIEGQFGVEVALLVDGLTDASDMEQYPTLKRKWVQAERLIEKNTSVKRVKLADGTSNVRSVVTDPPVHWDRQKTLDYVVGCSVVAHVCRDITPDLDQLFWNTYKEALDMHQ